MTMPITSRECEAGRCTACTGDAEFTGSDALTECEHRCHAAGGVR